MSYTMWSRRLERGSVGISERFNPRTTLNLDHSLCHLHDYPFCSLRLIEWNVLGFKYSIAGLQKSRNFFCGELEVALHLSSVSLPSRIVSLLLTEFSWALVVVEL